MCFSLHALAFSSAPRQQICCFQALIGKVNPNQAGRLNLTAGVPQQSGRFDPGGGGGVCLYGRNHVGNWVDYFLRSKVPRPDLVFLAIVESRCWRIQHFLAPFWIRLGSLLPMLLRCRSSISTFYDISAGKSALFAFRLLLFSPLQGVLCRLSTMSWSLHNCLAVGTKKKNTFIMVVDQLRSKDPTPRWSPEFNRQLLCLFGQTAQLTGIR